MDCLYTIYCLLQFKLYRWNHTIFPNLHWTTTFIISKLQCCLI